MNAVYKVLLFIVSLYLTACINEEFSETEVNGNGISHVSFDMTYRPMDDAMKKSRATAGDAIRDINDIFVVWYNTKGEKSGSQYFDKEQLTITDKDHSKGNMDTQETSTKNAKFECHIPYGEYRIYTAVNMGDLSKKKCITTEDGFKKMSIDWNSEDIAKNNQMSGYFTTSSEPISVSDKTPSVSINSGNTQLHAWVRRLASKVTVGFDATELYDNIYIYIKSVQLKDIPKACTLVDDNKPDNEEELITEGETLIYGEKQGDEDGLQITRGFTSEASKVHANNAASLFFYENMQGEDDKKHQYNNFENKDNKPYGTYLEVKAFYKNRTNDNTSHGNIIYRFMLGKNATDDFNAERNGHYKVTLKFNYHANDPDWHIVYEPEQPELDIPDPVYITYLPNEHVDIPVIVRGGNNKTQVTAEIIDSHWYPDYTNGQERHKYMSSFNETYNGILSMASNSNNLENKVQREDDFDKNKSRQFSPYKVESDRNIYNVPVYTRGINLGNSLSGYNYYPHRTRTGKIKFTATINNETVTKEVRVVQVKRVVNPTGLWREATSTKPFEFCLMELNEDDNNEYGARDINFQPTVSDGPWTASIVEGYDWIQIKSKDNEEWGTNNVTGNTASEVRFDVRPGSTCDEDKVRCGVVKITYHNNTCTHYFFVSQGIGDVTMHGIQWMNRNLQVADKPVDNPLMEGGKFRWGNTEYSIKPHDDFREGYGFNKERKDLPHQVYGSEEEMYLEDIKVASTTDGFKGQKLPDGYVPANESQWINLNNDARYYGVLYGEECETTATTTNDAYTYLDKKDKKGMQGLFIWSENDKNHLFFPIGASGFGHIKYDDKYQKDWGGDGTPKYDVLKYAQRSLEMPKKTAEGLPMYYDLWMRKGAIYWYNNSDGNDFAHDINYYTYGFSSYEKNPIDNANKITKSDALFIRCVKK